MYIALHKWVNGLKRYRFPEIGKLETVKNGIYLIFEDGEKFEEYDRITRVGSHPGQNRFYKRLTDHFLANHRKSIMRKHIGRCYLHSAKDPYIAIWDLTNSEVKKGTPGEKLVDSKKEHEIENQVSAYLNHFSIAVIPRLNDSDYRMSLESKFIATLNLSSSQFISSNWLGKQHPNPKIAMRGLWNIQGLDGTEYITEEDFAFLKASITHE